LLEVNHDSLNISFTISTSSLFFLPSLAASNISKMTHWPPKKILIIGLKVKPVSIGALKESSRVSFWLYMFTSDGKDLDSYSRWSFFFHN
jgi:hypothetical protein